MLTPYKALICVDLWNQDCPRGTRVRVDGSLVEDVTRSQAWVDKGDSRRALVMLEKGGVVEVKRLKSVGGGGGMNDMRVLSYDLDVGG